MNEKNQILESFVSDVTVKQKRTAVWFTIVSLIAVVIGLSLLAYFSKQVKGKIDQLGTLEQQKNEVIVEFTKLSDRNADLDLKNRDAQSQLEATTNEVSQALAKLETIYGSNLPSKAKIAIADAIAKIRGAEITVNKVETELKAAQQNGGFGPTISRSQAISDLFSDQAGKRLGAYNVIMDRYSNDPALVPELLAYARRNMSNQNGIYNTLVVLSHLNKAQLKPHVADIRTFAKEVEPAGPRIKQRVDKLLDRLPA